jgi:hypothetical protein
MGASSTVDCEPLTAATRPIDSGLADVARGSREVAVSMIAPGADCFVFVVRHRSKYHMGVPGLLIRELHAEFRRGYA